MFDSILESNLLLGAGITIIYILVVVYLANRIINNNYISAKRKKICIVLTCINPLLGLLYYHWETNKSLKKRYSSKAENIF